MKSKQVCRLFKDDELLNPYTHRPIKKHGPTHRRLQKACTEDIKPCEHFKDNYLINPYTNRKIKKNGPTYRRLINECCLSCSCFSKCSPKKIRE